MISMKLSVAAVWILCVWTIGYAADCGKHQVKTDGQCCDMCRPGEYMVMPCDKKQQTVCHPCKKGYFSSNFTNFDRCIKCRTCKQEYAENCTGTTDAKCSCRLGFLCSNNLCTTCEENKCPAWETLMRKGIPSGDMTEFSYWCEPKCPNNTYLDGNSCHPFTKCSTIGLAELFRGNKTHDSVCGTNAKNNGDSLNVILGIGFVLVSLALLLFLCYVCIKSLRKHRGNTTLMKVDTNASALKLSKEESARQFILQHESKDGRSLDQLHVGEVTV